jgi:hypothetical protein
VPVRVIAVHDDDDQGSGSWVISLVVESPMGGGAVGFELTLTNAHELINALRATLTYIERDGAGAHQEEP